MPFLSELERRAFDDRHAGRQPPKRALLAAADDIDNGMPAKHVLVVVVYDGGEETDVIQLYQAGELSVLAAEGALGRAIRVQAHDAGVE